MSRISRLQTLLPQKGHVEALSTIGMGMGMGMGMPISLDVDMDTPLPPHVYLRLLQQCRNNKTLLPRAKQIYAHLLHHHRHIPLPGPVAHSLVMTLASCGALQEALHLSRALPHRTVFSWTALISAHVNMGRPKEALLLYHSMLDDGVEPDRYTFVSLFKACGCILDIELAQQLHEYADRMGVTSDMFVGNTLISMYGKCGDIVEAEHVFCTMCHRTVVSWNSMLSAFLEHSHGERALQLYVKMQQEECIAPDHATSVVCLQACAMLVEDGRSTMVALEIGQGLHAYIRHRSLGSHIFVASTLVSMYGKCKAISEAQHAFTLLSQHDVVSWNVMLSAYVEQGQGKQALQLYVQMQRDGIAPDTLSFTVAIQACVALVGKEEYDHLNKGSIALELGLALHADAQVVGATSDAFVGNTLLSMYGKSGAIVEAEHVFHRISHHDTVSWNAMLSAYVEKGQAEKALRSFLQMIREAVNPDQLTYVVSAQACSILADTEEAVLEEGQSVKEVPLEIGRALHSEARRKGFLLNQFVGSTLVSMYGKCGALSEAEHMFNAMTHHDVVSWNSMLSCYVEQGKGQSALHLYRCMQREGVSPDQLTFMSCIQACIILADVDLFMKKQSSSKIFLEIGKALHADACKKGFLTHAFVANTLVSMYGKCGALLEAENVFSDLYPRSTVTWNAILSAYVDQGQGARALQLYRNMQREGMALDQLTCVIALQACSCLAEKEVAICLEEGLYKVTTLEIGRALCSDAHREGFTSDVTVGNALVSMFGKCGAILEAKNVFNSLNSRTIVSWNAMLSSYIEQGQGEEALQLYKEMLKQCVIFDHITPICILQACSKIGSLETCQHIHFVIIAAGYEFSSSLAAPLIHAYGSCAAMKNGIAFFSSIREPDIMSWNACINGCATGASIDMLDQLNHSGIKPDEVTFISIISACSHAGLNNKGLECFVAMGSEYGLIPDLKHYGSVIDLLGRAGDFKSIKNMLEAMPFEADVALWLCVMGACCTHGNMELAKEAFHHAVKLQPKQGISYVLMSNIYANGNLFRCIDEKIPMLWAT